MVLKPLRNSAFFSKSTLLRGIFSGFFRRIGWWLDKHKNSLLCCPPFQASSQYGTRSAGRAGAAEERQEEGERAQGEGEQGTTEDVGPSCERGQVQDLHDGLQATEERQAQGTCTKSSVVWSQQRPCMVCLFVFVVVCLRVAVGGGCIVVAIVVLGQFLIFCAGLSHLYLSYNFQRTHHMHCRRSRH